MKAVQTTLTATSLIAAIALPYGCASGARSANTPPLRPRDATTIEGDAGTSRLATSLPPDAAAPPARSDAPPDVFHVWFRSNDELRVLAGNGALIYGPEITAAVDGDLLKVNPSPAFGSFNRQEWAVFDQPMRLASGADGSWPNATYFSATPVSADCRCGCPNILHTWRGNHWQTARVHMSGTRKDWRATLGWESRYGMYDSQASLGSVRFAWLAPIDERRVFASTVGPDECGNGPTTVDTRVLGDGIAEAKTPRPATVSAKPGALTQRSDSLRALAWPSGEFFALGHDRSGKLVSETWASVETPGVVLPILVRPAGAEPTDLKLTSRNPRDIWLGGTREKGAVLMHYDGAAWSEVKPPMGSPITSMAGETDGRLYLTTVSGEMWFNDAGLTWSKAALPPNVKVYQLSVGKAAGRRDVWAAGDKVVLRNAAPKEERFLKQGARQRASDRKERPLTAPLEGCWSYFVPIYTASVTNDEYAFPLAQKALSGHREFATLQFGITTGDGRFGGITDNYELAKQFAAFAQRNIKNAMPRVLCETVAVRAVAIRTD